MPNPNPFSGQESALGKISDGSQAKPVDAKVLSTNDDMKGWNEVVRSGSASKSAPSWLPDFNIGKEDKKVDVQEVSKKDDAKEGTKKDSKEKETKDKETKDKDGKTLIEIGKSGAGVGGVVLEKQDTLCKVGGEGGGSKRGPKDNEDVKQDLKVKLEKLGEPSKRDGGLHGEPKFRH